ncbi:hypothetical protein ACFLRI_05515 [Bacteroidota bacterium]
MKKNSGASYLFNYRYSTMGLIKEVFPAEIKDFLPVYQDLCFKINIPTEKTGVFSIWGLAADDIQITHAVEDSSLWGNPFNRQEFNFSQRMGALGMNHRLIIKGNAYLNTSVAFSGDQRSMEGGILGDDLKRYDKEYTKARNYKLTISSVFNKKFSARHVNRSGIILDKLHYNTVLKYAQDYEVGLLNIADEKDATNMLQLFSQSKISLTEKFTVNAGLHGQYFELNDEFVIEPRLGFSYKVGKRQSVGIAYGNHSRLEPLQLYFTNVNDGFSITQPNKDLNVSKSHHLVVSYDISINPNLRLKIEPYVQFLYDIPVIPDSSFSMLNMEADWYFNKKLINTGTGKNMGVDFTLERFLKDGYYYLVTASLFDSKYTGDDGIERNTRFNTNYVFNVLFGKEWTLGSQKNKILGVNARVNYLGGKRTSPIDISQSRLAESVVYDYSKLYEDRESNSSFVSATINYQVNKKKHTGIWSLQVSNLLASKENYGLYYNSKTKNVEAWEFTVVIPNLSYKIEF